jgi:short-subunit dehydrogenase
MRCKGTPFFDLGNPCFGFFVTFETLQPSKIGTLNPIWLAMRNKITMGKNHFLGKVVLITGASSGIGKACAFEFAKRGAKVVLGARNTNELSAIVDLISKDGGVAVGCHLDVTNQESCKSFVEYALSTYGNIDVLINNAGISMRAIFEDLDLNVIRKLMDVNFWGTVYCTKYALPALLQSKGSVIGVSSIAGFMGLPGRTGYSSSKFAMNGFLETLRVETLKQGLHVMVVAPGFTASNVRLNALNQDGQKQGETPREESKMMTSEEVAHRIANGIERKKRTLVMTLVGKVTVFLSKIAPALLDKLAFNEMAKEPNTPLKR